MKKNLKETFIPKKYTISDLGDDQNKVVIEGQKLAPPSKRITLHQQNIKVISAKIIYKHKRDGIEFEISRINHIKSFKEIRLHTNNVLYPGTYVITLEYSGKLDEEKLKQ